MVEALQQSEARLKEVLQEREIVLENSIVGIAFLTLFFAWPLVAILRRSLVVDGRLDVPWGVVTSDLTRDVLWFTFWQATVSTALTLVAALPLAWALSRFRFRHAIAAP